MSREIMLTQREEQVLRLCSLGKRNREVAADLGVAESTIKNHLSNIFRKLGVTNRSAAYQRRGWLNSNERPLLSESLRDALARTGLHPIEADFDEAARQVLRDPIFHEDLIDALAEVIIPAMYDKGYQNPALFAERIVARLLADSLNA